MALLLQAVKLVGSKSLRQGSGLVYSAQPTLQPMSRTPAAGAPRKPGGPDEGLQGGN